MLAEHRFELKDVSGVINLADGWRSFSHYGCAAPFDHGNFPGEK
jgi:hypothetical protein